MKFFAKLILFFVLFWIIGIASIIIFQGMSQFFILFVGVVLSISLQIILGIWRDDNG